MSTPHVSVATAIEINRLATDVAFVLVLDVTVVDLNGTFVETLHLAKNAENIIWNGNVYAASNFDVKLDMGTGTTPSFVVNARDPSGVIRSRMEMYEGGVGFAVTMSVINTGNLTQPPEIQETFQVVGAATSGFDVTLTMGVDNPLLFRFPQRLEFRDQCPFVYKGPRCKYAGGLATCDFTYFGANGCKFHANSANFGGFPGLQNMNVAGGVQ